MSPIVAFRFQVAFSEESLSGAAASPSDVPLCSGSFSECSGIEATMEPHVVKEGGRNYGTAQRVGKVTFGTVVLKRGLTSNQDLWRWFELVTLRAASTYRLSAVLTIVGPEGAGVQWTWQLLRCLPVKFKAPDLNATSSQIAIEELHLAHEGLVLLAGPSAGLSASVSASASFSLSASASGSFPL